jgi:hypothetical protein
MLIIKSIYVFLEYSASFILFISIVTALPCSPYIPPNLSYCLQGSLLHPQ